MNDKIKMKSTINTSEGSAPYIEALYESFLKDPNSVSKDWKIYFETLPKNPDNEEDVSHKDVIKKFKNQRRRRSYSSKSIIDKFIDEKQIRVIQLIQSYRNRGHQRANLDPLGIRKNSTCEDLDIEFHGLQESDLGKKFNTDTLNINQDDASLDEIISSLKNQMANKVKWTDSIKQLEKTGLSKIIEIGPGKVLSGLLKRINKEVKIDSINSEEDIKNLNI